MTNRISDNARAWLARYLETEKEHTALKRAESRASDLFHENPTIQRGYQWRAAYAALSDFYAREGAHGALGALSYSLREGA
jgi:hypothetical protein